MVAAWNFQAKTSTLNSVGSTQRSLQNRSIPSSSMASSRSSLYLLNNSPILWSEDSSALETESFFVSPGNVEGWLDSTAVSAFFVPFTRISPEDFPQAEVWSSLWTALLLLCDLLPDSLSPFLLPRVDEGFLHFVTHWPMMLQAQLLEQSPHRRTPSQLLFNTFHHAISGSQLTWKTVSEWNSCFSTKNIVSIKCGITFTSKRQTSGYLSFAYWKGAVYGKLAHAVNFRQFQPASPRNQCSSLSGCSILMGPNKGNS